VLFTLRMLEGLSGYSLPDDLPSGTGLQITQGVIQSIPIAGTYISFFLFGGQFPGHGLDWPGGGVVAGSGSTIGIIMPRCARACLKSVS
jgi:Cytochrome b(N-terminal)/b6/petB